MISSMRPTKIASEHPSQPEKKASVNLHWQGLQENGERTQLEKTRLSSI